MNFTSDNAGPAHPTVLEAVVAANSGHAAAYGADELTARVTARLRDVFEAPRAAVYLVATGTAANALALACLCPPWATIFCHAEAHVEVDECGAPEFYTGGAKLVRLRGADARVAPEALERAIAETGRGGVHNVQRGALSLTNATEAGTVYGPDEVGALAEVARSAGVPVHMDGARFANALVATGASPADMTWRAGVDVLSFGGTKNGLMGAEAVILFDPARAWEFELRRKRGGHLFSKHRYLAAQMDAYLDDGLWLDLAGRANARAAELSQGLVATGRVTLLHPTQANAVFAAWPRGRHRAAMEGGAKYYLWPHGQALEGSDATAPLGARLVCNWATLPEDVSEFVTLLAGVPAARRA